MKTPEFTAWLTEEYDGFFEGSCIHVDKESKNFYYGSHSSMGCTMTVKFPKSKCTTKNPMEAILNPDLSKCTPEQLESIRIARDKLTAALEKHSKRM